MKGIEIKQNERGIHGDASTNKCFIRGIISMAKLYFNGKFLISLIVSLFMPILFSCATNAVPTGTKVQLTPENKNNLKGIGIVINQEKDFNVRSARDSPNTGYSGLAPGLLGMILMAMEKDLREKADRKKAEALQSRIEKYDLKNNFLTKLSEYAIQGELCKNIVKLNEGEIKDSKTNNLGANAILKVTVKNWGVRRTSDPKENRKGYLQTEFDINAKIFFIDNIDKEAWSMDDQYISDKKYLFSEIQNDPSILIKSLDEGISDLSKKIINRILY